MAATRYWVIGPGPFGGGGIGGTGFMSTSPDPAPTSYRLRFEVGFVGDQVPGFTRIYPLEIEPLFTDTPANVAAKLIDGVQALATSKGHPVNRADGLIPTYQRGS
jgi:hypothetical protein